MSEHIRFNQRRSVSTKFAPNLVQRVCNGIARNVLMNHIGLYLLHILLQLSLRGDDPKHRDPGGLKRAGAGTGPAKEVHRVTTAGESSRKQRRGFFHPANCIRRPYCHSHMLS